MEQLAERLSQEEILCDEEVDEDDEEIKKLKNEKVSLVDTFISLHLFPIYILLILKLKTGNVIVSYKFSAH